MIQFELYFVTERGKLETNDFFFLVDQFKIT